MNIIKEHFDSINQMITVIESRKNNEVMKDCRASKEGSRSFTGTKSYNEAKELFETGYTEVLQDIKKGTANQLKHLEVTNRRMIRTNIVGYAPCVPNAILGLPNSMISIDNQPQKVKAISIVAGICANCGTDAEEFIKSGVAVLGVVNTLELQGYRVNLKVAFYYAQYDDEKAFGTVSVKNYREQLDLQKLCFPLANPSMFRRFGFKWLETVTGLKNNGWSCGYGRTLHDENKIKDLFLDDNEFFIGLETTRNNDYDVDKIIKQLKLSI